MALDTSQYESQRRSVNSRYGAQAAANEYGRFVAQQRTSRQTADNARSFSGGWPKLAAAWGQRGQTGPNVRSGFYQNAMQQYVQQGQRNTNDLLQQYADEQRGFDLSASQYATDRDAALADIEAQKQREIALTAMNIRQLRPIIGR